MDWDLLLKIIGESTMECLQVEDRIRYLAESPEEAVRKYVACERRYGREWRIPEEYR